MQYIQHLDSYTILDKTWVELYLIYINNVNLFFLNYYLAFLTLYTGPCVPAV